MFGIVVVAAAAMTLHPNRFPDTPLFAGVSGARTYEAGQQLVETRLKERNPIGTPEGDLADFLRAQGMEIRRTTHVGADGHSVVGLARVLQGPGVCDKTVVVTWDANRAGVLTDLKVVYGDTGFL